MDYCDSIFISLSLSLSPFSLSSVPLQFLLAMLAFDTHNNRLLAVVTDVWFVCLDGEPVRVQKRKNCETDSYIADSSGTVSR